MHFLLGITPDYGRRIPYNLTNLILFQGALLTILRLSCFFSFGFILSTTQGDIPIVNKLFMGFICVVVLYFAADRPVLKSIRKQLFLSEFKISTLYWALVLKYIFIYYSAPLHQRLVYGTIDASKLDVLATISLLAAQLLEMAVVAIEFYVVFRIKRMAHIKGEAIAKTYDKKDVWIEGISRANTGQVIADMLADSNVKQNGALRKEIIALSSRWHEVESLRAKGVEDIDRLIKHTNAINDSLIRIVDRI